MFRRRPVLVLFVALLLWESAWALATPLFGYPDEPDHVVRAVAVAQGQFVAEADHGVRGTGAAVRVPASIGSSMTAYRCIWPVTGQVLPGNCEPRLASSHRQVTVQSGAGRYFPPYYAAVGWLGRLVPNADGIYLMRLLTALVSVVMVATGFACVRRWSDTGLGVVGVLVAATPCVLYFGAGVNPSAWEISGGFMAWCGLIGLARSRISDRLCPVAAGAGLTVMLLTRALAPLWVVTMIVVALLLRARDPGRRWWRRTAVLGWTPVLAVVAAASMWWTKTQGSLELSHSRYFRNYTIWRAITDSFGLSGDRIRQLIAVFGWQDTTGPYVSLLLWAIAGGALVAGALLFSRMRERVALLLLLLAVVFAPVAAEATTVRRFGFTWQGRYTLPLAVGVPLLAAAALETAAGSAMRSTLRHAVRSIVVPAATAIGVAQLLSFLTVLRRYEWGRPAPLNPFGGPWQPPGGSILVVLAAVAAMALYVAATATASLVDPAPVRHEVDADKDRHGDDLAQPRRHRRE